MNSYGRNDLEKERMSFQNQGRTHLTIGILLTAVAAVSLFLCDGIGNWLATVMSSSAQSDTVFGRLPYALVSTAIFSTTIALPLFVGLFWGIAFGAINLRGGKVWCDRAEQTIATGKPVPMIMNLSLRKPTWYSKFFPSFGSIQCDANLSASGKEINDLKVVIQQEAALDLLDFEPREVLVYIPNSDLDPIVAIHGENLIIEQPTDLDLNRLLVSVKTSKDQPLDPYEQAKAELKTSIVTSIIALVIMGFLIAISSLIKTPSIGDFFPTYLLLLYCFNLFAALHRRAKLADWSSSSAEVMFEQNGQDLTAIVKRGGIVETLRVYATTVAPKRVLNRCEQMETGLIYINNRSGKIAGVARDGILFLSAEHGVRKLAALAPIACLLISFGINYESVKPAPKMVPTSGLNAMQYLNLGAKYVIDGEYIKARSALKYGMAIANDSSEKTRIQNYTKGYLPAQGPSKELEDALQRAWSLSDQKAKEILVECIKKNPDNEIPYRRLAAIYVREKNTKEAVSLLNKSLDINPHYVRALSLMVSCKQTEKDEAGVRSYASKILQYDPDNRRAALVKQFPQLPLSI